MKTLTSIFIIFLFAATSWATDLSTATLKQLVIERPDLVKDIKSGKDEGSSTVSIVKDAQGRMSIWTEKKLNLNGDIVGKRVDRYIYYSTDNVNEIIQERYEGIELTLVSKRKIKHYEDGTQPDVIPMSIEIPKKL